LNLFGRRIVQALQPMPGFDERKCGRVAGVGIFFPSAKSDGCEVYRRSRAKSTRL
jgi:hypothetical protein